MYILRCEDCGTTFNPTEYKRDNDGAWMTRDLAYRFACGCAHCGGTSLTEEDEEE